MHQTFCVEALGDPQAIEHFDGALFQHACTYALEHVLAAALLDDDRVDAGADEELAEEKTGRAGSNDCDLGTH
jgi:Mn-dependent DtxR family transcriptional regulator